MVYEINIQYQEYSKHLKIIMCISIGVNPNGKSAVEPRRWSDVNFAIFPEAASVELVPLNPTSDVERWVLMTGQPRISTHFAQASRRKAYA